MATHILHTAGKHLVAKKPPLKLGHAVGAHIALKKLKRRAGPHSVKRVLRKVK
jgi:hypothetical protein